MSPRRVSKWEHGIVAMLRTLLVSLKQRAQRDVLEPSVRSLPTLHAVLDRAAERAGWDEVAVNRLQLAGEEAFLCLLPGRLVSMAAPTAAIRCGLASRGLSCT